MRQLLFAVLLFHAITSFGQQALAQSHRADIVIYGATSAAVTAAVEAKRCGKSVIIVGPDKHLGGLSAGGLGWTDTGNKAVIGGIAREFYHRIWKKYQDDAAWKWQARESYGNRGQGTAAIDGKQRTMWIFEPHVAESVFEDFVSDFDITVHRDQWLDRERGVTMKGGRIDSIRMLSGQQYVGKMFIDATYEGDLLAAAGVDFHVGRESSEQYNEEWNGNQVGIYHHKHWFSTKISAYRTPGDPSSGLVARVSDTPPGSRGEADDYLQAYCYRMCLTNHIPNQIPSPKPEGYDPDQYQLLLRVLLAEWQEVFNKFDPIPNLKTDTNNHGPFSTDNIGMNYDYPEATYERRLEILQEHEIYQKGLMYFLANDKRVPDKIRGEFAKWGLSKDEFTDNGGWPHQIYVREARRMIGPYVMTEHDCLDKKQTPKSVGMGSYTMDSHNVRRYVTDDGYVQNEGDIGVKVPRPYEISYDSLTPREEQCENLLVPVCLSSSHIAFGSIRMEPVFMILGHSAAAAASMAIDNDTSVQNVSYESLKKQLEEEGQILELASLAKTITQDFEGIVVDEEYAHLEGGWSQSTSAKPFVGFGYRHDGNQNQGSARATFSSELPSGNYRVRISFTPHSNRATNTSVTIRHANGTKQLTINQRQPGTLIDDLWLDVGSYPFQQQGSVEISNQAADGHVIIDAVQFLPANND